MKVSIRYWMKRSAKNKLVCNHAKDIADTASSYFIGNPVSYKAAQTSLH